MGIEKCTKTKSSNRTIDILDSLKPYLQNQYELTGHKNSAITLEVYARYIKSKEKKRGSFLEEGLSSKIDSQTTHQFVA